MNKFVVNFALIAVSTLIICYSIFRSWEIEETQEVPRVPIENIIVDATITGVNQATATSYTLESKMLRHFSADQPSELTAPRIHQQLSGDSSRTVSGDSAMYWPNEGTVVFQGNVEITITDQEQGNSRVSRTKTFTVHLK